ncbi:MAG: tRNA (adenosine(37)-N6)-threonylcarbamoyltransferase complex dimerization subunit type 1 TsaB [Bacteroidales bacterium]|jgi:tRNA threonylcarbamoyladenosine biosynthesis protein TsaB|nr:tRNA (adenosine(37)-N6)-threonylcarbamoyltransferase complex dimerization subunit type 1 TsaB [Bacteroidales bacterium]
MILCLETSSPVCSVALCTSDGVVALKESRETRSHASLLTVYIREVLSEAGITVGDLDAIAVSKGPGSYTGLRIGVSVAKGIAYASTLPLISVETTLSMFHGISDAIRLEYATDAETIFIPMIDARRMEVYYSVFSSDGKVLKDISAEIIDENAFSWIDEAYSLLFFGDGAEKCMKVLKRNKILYVPEFTLSAKNMYKPAYVSFENKQFEDVAYFEPFYLKDFITSKPKKGIIGR